MIIYPILHYCSVILHNNDQIIHIVMIDNYNDVAWILSMMDAAGLDGPRIPSDGQSLAGRDDPYFT